MVCCCGARVDGRHLRKSWHGLVCEDLGKSRPAWRQIVFAGTTKDGSKANVVLCACRRTSYALHRCGGLQCCAPWVGDAFDPARPGIPRRKLIALERPAATTSSQTPQHRATMIEYLDKQHSHGSATSGRPLHNPAYQHLGSGERYAPELFVSRIGKHSCKSSH